jgi:hypothetical protein
MSTDDTPSAANLLRSGEICDLAPASRCDAAFAAIVGSDRSLVTLRASAARNTPGFLQNAMPFAARVAF